MNNLPPWITERTMLWRLDAGKFSRAPEVITGKGSYYGGRSKNGRYLATGYPAAYLYDVPLDNRIRYFLPPYSGRDDTGQVCNLSISPSLSNPDQLMFLDFGYSKTSTVVGKSYGFHSIIFVCNSCVSCPSHVQKWFEVPSGYAEWDFVKWSNHPGFAAAIAMNQNSGSAGALFLISLKDSSYLKVAQGDGLCDPYLWIDPSQVSELPDPYVDFAKYDVPMEANYGSQTQLTEKLKLFWKRCAAFQVAVVGSSPAFYRRRSRRDPVFPVRQHGRVHGRAAALRGAGPELFPAAFAAEGRDHGPRPGFPQQRLPLERPVPRRAVRLAGVPVRPEEQFLEGGVPGAGRVQDRRAHARLLARLRFDRLYELSRPSGGWGDTLIDKGDYAFSDTFVQTNLRTIAASADTLAAHGVELIIVNYPQNPLYKYTSSIGRYGPSRATYGLVTQWVDSLCRANPSVHFYDANNGGDHDYDGSEAFDPNHLNYLGAQKLSRRLDSLLTLYVK